MSAPAIADRSFNVTYRLGADDAPVPAGTVRLDAALRLELVSAEERFRKLLTRAVTELNKQSHFTVATPPPAGAPRFGVYGQRIPRDAPEAEAALMTVLAKEYGLTLDPV
jgi:hypothetical protein